MVSYQKKKVYIHLKSTEVSSYIERRRETTKNRRIILWISWTVTSRLKYNVKRFSVNPSRYSLLTSSFYVSNIKFIYNNNETLSKVEKKFNFVCVSGEMTMKKTMRSWVFCWLLVSWWELISLHTAQIKNLPLLTSYAIFYIEFFFANEQRDESTNKVKLN
jgi:hypothetical protein